MRILMLTTLCVLLAACGFQLRGVAQLPFAKLYVSGPESSAVVNDIKRDIQTGTSTRLVKQAAEAEATLDVLAENRDKIILSLTSDGRVREFQLRLRVNYRLTGGQAQELIPVNEIVLNRVISFSDTQVVAKETEEALLYRDMQADIVQQIMRRLATVKPAS